MGFNFGRSGFSTKDITYRPPEESYQNSTRDKFYRGKTPLIPGIPEENVLKNDGNVAAFYDPASDAIIYFGNMSDTFLPVRDEHLGAYRLFAPVDFEIKPKGAVVIFSGVSVAMHPDHCLLVSLAPNEIYGLLLAGPTMYMPDYYNSEQDGGQLKINIINFSNNIVEFKKGETLALLSFVERLQIKSADNFEIED